MIPTDCTAKSVGFFGTEKLPKNEVRPATRDKVFYAGPSREAEGLLRDYFSMPSNSTSKINTLLGGIAWVGLWSP